MRLYTDSFHYHCTIHQSTPNLPYLLMLHGFMGSGKVYDHLIGNLTSFCNPITIDLSGHGKTESLENSKFYTAERQVKQLNSVLQRLHFDDLYLYGYSMGGRLSFQFLASHSNLFSGAIIESSHCGIVPETDRTYRQNLDEKRAQQIEQNYWEYIEDWMKLPLFQHTPEKMKSVYKEVMKAQNPMTIAASLRGFGAGMMPSVCDKINELNLKLTLIAGELDQKYVNRMSKIHESKEHSVLHIVKDAGHRVHADQPGKLISIFKKAMNT